MVRLWLERRFTASRLDQAAPDRRGYEGRDDFDKAAAEEWVCRLLKNADCTNDQMTFATRLKALIAQEDYPATGMNDDARFERHVRSYVRKLAKMTKANDGFGNTFRHQ
ncbi:hypothetical protein D9601_13600 [Sphingomonas sp. MA1305]|nr:hypothetical protein [Sphingomonas sp. MA1305]